MEKEPKEAKEIFEEAFTIWVISTRQAGFKARLNAEDLNLDPEDIDSNVTLGNKKMIPDPDRIKLNSAPGMIQNFMRSVSRRFFGRGLYAVPENKVLACQYGLNKIKDEIKNRVEDFISRYPEVRQEQTRKHPNLANEQWPSNDDIRRFYNVTWKVFSISSVTIKGSDPDDLVEAKEQFQKELKEGYEQLKNEILGESYIEILKAIDTINAKLASGDLTETNLKKPTQILDQYLSISSIFDLPEITRKVEELQKAMKGTKAKDTREKPLVSEILKEKLTSIGKQLEELTGYSKDGRRKRTVDLDPDPEENPEVKAA